jgi:hypothetical protein
LYLKFRSILATGEHEKWGKRKRRGKGFDSMPYPQRRSTEAIEFHERKRRRRSVHGRPFYVHGGSTVGARARARRTGARGSGGAAAGDAAQG